jgi:hypothetical protein
MYHKPLIKYFLLIKESVNKHNRMHSLKIVDQILLQIGIKTLSTKLEIFSHSDA